MRIITYISLLALGAALASCMPHRELLNFREGPALPLGQPQDIANATVIKVQPDDLLDIVVSSTDPAAAAPFNLSIKGGGEGFQGGSYLVDPLGNIDFPVLGRISVAGLSRHEIRDTIARKMGAFIQAPVVQVRFANFKITVLGEVGSPSTHVIKSDRITILEALSLSGDLTSYSKRDSILIIREMGGKREFGKLDVTSTSVFQSPYFYLQPNDVVYVEPSKYKMADIRDPITKYLPWGISIVSLVALIWTRF